MSSKVDTLLPVGTLILGAVLSQVQANWGSTRKARLEARQILAEAWRIAWDKNDGSYLNLRSYQGKLRGYLRAAGVPVKPIQRFNTAIAEFWQHVEDTGDPEIGSHIDQNWYDALEEASESLWQLLDDGYSHRFRARRRTA